MTASPCPKHEHDCAGVQPAPPDAMRAQSLTKFRPCIWIYPIIPVLSVLFCAFSWPVTFSDPTSELLRPETGRGLGRRRRRRIAFNTRAQLHAVQRRPPRPWFWG